MPSWRKHVSRHPAVRLHSANEWRPLVATVPDLLQPGNSKYRPLAHPSLPFTSSTCCREVRAAAAVTFLVCTVWSMYSVASQPHVLQPITSSTPPWDASRSPVEATTPIPQTAHYVGRQEEVEPPSLESVLCRLGIFRAAGEQSSKALARAIRIRRPPDESQEAHLVGDTLGA